jgi:DNA replication protein DnaC
MLGTPTVERLRELGLTAMADALLRQREMDGIEELGFEERLGLLLDLEHTARENRRLERRLREAHLRIAASLEDVDARASRGLDRAAVLGFADETWLRQHAVVLISGATGTGKTFLACALGQSAARLDHSVRYYKTTRLVEEMALARAQGKWERLLARLARFELLILDDWGIAPLTAAQGRDLLEIVDDRVQRRATVVSSQLPVDKWHEHVADPTVADAILDRLVHGAYRFELKGESQRKLRSTSGGRA